MVYFLVKYLTDPSYTEYTTLLNDRIVPLLIAYGAVLFTSIGVDSYWTVQALYFHKEGKKLMAEIVREHKTMVVPISSNNTSMFTEVPSPY